MDLAERTATERRHPWELERFEFFRSVLESHGACERIRVLDVGSGDSWFVGQLVALLDDGAEVHGWDSEYTPTDLTDAPPGVRRSVRAPDGPFDLVLMMDVLEHIERPEEFLRDEIAPRLGPGAIVLASVPAHPWLFNDHDVALSHFRRYRPREFVEQVSGVCAIDQEGPLFVSLVAPRLFAVVLGRLRPRGRRRDAAQAEPEAIGIGGWSRGPVVTRLARRALALDAAACRMLARRGRSLPGLSHWAIGHV